MPLVHPFDEHSAPVDAPKSRTPVDAATLALSTISASLTRSLPPVVHRAQFHRGWVDSMVFVIRIGTRPTIVQHTLLSQDTLLCAVGPEDFDQTTCCESVISPRTPVLLLLGRSRTSNGGMVAIKRM